MLTMKMTVKKKTLIRNEKIPSPAEEGEKDENVEYSSVADGLMGSSNASFDLDDSTDQQAKTSSSDGGREQIAKKETTAVKSLKLLVLVVLVLSMVTVTVGVYIFSSNAEQKDFEDAYSDYTVKIFASLGENIDLTLGAVDAFVITIVSYARGTNQTWPFVTIPDFAVRGAKIRSLSSATILIMYQYVSHENRAALGGLFC